MTRCFLRYEVPVNYIQFLFNETVRRYEMNLKSYHFFTRLTVNMRVSNVSAEARNGNILVTKLLNRSQQISHFDCSTKEYKTESVELSNVLAARLASY